MKTNIRNTYSIRNIVSSALLAAFAALPASVSAQSVKISVSDANFTAPLIEKWVSEYKKVQPQFEAEIITTSAGADATVNISKESEKEGVVGRFFVLPIANAQNSILENKKVRRGLDGKTARALFVAPTLDEVLDDEADNKLPATVYSLTGNHALTATLYADKLGVLPSELRGKKILGKEESAISAVRAHSDAVSFGVSGLVYDLQTRRVANGLAVLPVDLNGNGKITDDERLAFENIDALTAYLENVATTGVPTGNISLKSNDSRLNDFIGWVSQQGQSYLSEFGYLKANAQLTAQK